MAPLIIGYCLALLLFLGLPWSDRVNPALKTDVARTRQTSAVLGIVHLIALVIPLVGAGTRYGPRAGMTAAWIAIGVMVLAIGLQRWAQHSLGNNFTLALQSAEDQRICTSGPYRWVRHPAYLAQIMLWIGLATTSRSIVVMIVIAALTAGAYTYRLCAEERVLIDSLGDRYRIYAAQTKRLIPLIW